MSGPPPRSETGVGSSTDVDGLGFASMPRRALLCPACKKVVPLQEDLRPNAFPFCSDRCRMADLGRWFGEEYVVARPLGPEDHEAIEEVLRAREGDG